ncbi:restriction endonuclease [Acetobacteraceae bacterium H6797]|nr:restriction endonuclease [Acetobacteraceae bacterium H6797]
MLFESLLARGYQVEFTAHAEAILSVDFPDAAVELENALLGASIPIQEIIAGGGGESKGTQRLRRALASLGWNKFTFVVQKVINGVSRESQSHEIDHVKTFSNGKTIAMEIEWNNKDPFYDRDLENFKRLHADGAISVGVIVTRGRSLHEGMRDLVSRFLDEQNIDKLDDMREWGYDPTSKQRNFIVKQTTRSKMPLNFRDAFARKFTSDKFGEATTHWRKLEDRIHRGVGNPCPMVFIGLPSSIVTFSEGKQALVEIEAADAEADRDIDI